MDRQESRFGNSVSSKNGKASERVLGPFDIYLTLTNARRSFSILFCPLWSDSLESYLPEKNYIGCRIGLTCARDDNTRVLILFARASYPDKKTMIYIY